MSSDSFAFKRKENKDLEGREDDQEVAIAGTALKTQVIPNFVKQLDMLELIPIDSATLTKTFHSHGINMRFLGYVCQKTKLPHIKEICLLEMIGRAAKKIFRKELSAALLNSNREEGASIGGSLIPKVANLNIDGEQPKEATVA